MVEFNNGNLKESEEILAITKQMIEIGLILEEKLEKIYDELATMSAESADKTFDEMKALMGNTKKSLMGAV